MKFIKPHHLLFLILALAGLLTFRAYGQSWDEPLFYNYAAAIPAAYQPANWLNVPESVYGSSAEDHKQYGPAYLLLARPVEQTLVFLFRLEEGDAWHLVNFIGFLLALAFFRSLAKRTLPPNLATVATAFFALQPIFWGHAFINPKDIPFMSAFLAAMVFGLNWLDSLAAEKQKSKTEALARLMVAALALGVASAIRVIGPLAGILVIGYEAISNAERRIRSKEHKFSPSPLLSSSHSSFIIQHFAFILCSILVMFLLWPFLWQNPLTRLLEVLTHMSDNPTELAVLFRGQLFRANEMPVRYFPQMLALTLTLPTWPLALIGFVRMTFRRETRREALLYALWFGLVTAYILLQTPAVYDGFRHFFFIIPPLFIFVAHGIEEINFRIKPAPMLRFAFALLILLPGLLGILRLHPYEYTYYNMLTGGTGSAFRAYETDYWLTCYREALTWARQNQPETPVYVQREMHLAQIYGDGLTLLPLGVETPESLPAGARLLFSTRADLDIRSVFRNFPIEKAFGRENADFCLLKRKP
ncbi:MAG: hypothetical protein CO094_07550 [Anaerolineae bacterium CG_4_9_14_3_um_filter_57_17]|nr:MAG: hypothetical protein AUK01_06390 [Anaerolineae bacterium CG2_30_57_67]PJB66306.1 MAG: hypothetical protein CO094_07550 [Anaerolineae bacterium CG_4_9_14_3_um_filter_57_17]